jgi:uncharacterized protein YbcI
MPYVPETDGHVPHDPLNEISTGISSLYREYFGQDASIAYARHAGDVVICVLHGAVTPVERILIENRRARIVRETRAAFHEAVGDRFRGVVERQTGRRVEAFMSQTHLDPDLVVEVFVLGAKLARSPSG